MAGKSVTTIEGLERDGEHPVQRAWKSNNVPQCGYCQSGQIMQAAALLRKRPSRPTREIDTHMSRQHLPVRHLPAHSRGHQDSRGGEE